MQIDQAAHPTSDIGTRPVLWQALILISAFLLISMGGAIVAAPVTLPLLWFSLRRPALNRPWRITAAVVLALTAAEFTWAAVYLTLGESKPMIWLLPVGVAVLAAGQQRERCEEADTGSGTGIGCRWSRLL